MSGGGGPNDEGGLRSLPGARLGADSEARADGGHGQPLKAHKGGKVKEIIEGRGCELLYLPPYSPDLNPIEQVFREEVKWLLRKAEARTRESLIEAMGLALSAVSTRDVQGFFGHCGYRSMDQPL